MKQTILVIAYHFPPEEGSCSEKNIRIVKLLAENGYNVIVVTKGYEGISEMYCQDNVTILRTKKNGIFHKKLAPGSCNSVTATAGMNFKGRIKSEVSARFIPDGTIDWFIEIKRLLSIKKDLLKNSDIVLSISSPYSAHLASQYLAKQLGIPFIMCYGDPWIYEPKRKRGVVRYAIEKRLEGSLVHQAQKILLITEWNKKRYQELYKLPESKVYTYHIGFDASECLEAEIDNIGEELSIIYGGSLDRVHRNPEPFMIALSKVDKVKVAVYNSDDSELPGLVAKYNLFDKVELHPLIPSKQFYEELYKMDALLLFGNKTPFQVPGKVFTYISTGKGILYVKNNNYVNDGTEEVLKSYGNSVVVQNEVEDIVCCLEEMKANKKSGIIANKQPFEFHVTMSPIVEAVKEIIG